MIRKIMWLVLMAVSVVSSLVNAAPVPDVIVKNLSVSGEVQGENVLFTLDLKVDVTKRGATLDLVRGNLVFEGGTLPKRSELHRSNDIYSLQFNGRGEQHAIVTFAVAAGRQDEWRNAVFSVPNSVIRKLTVLCDREDLEIVFGGALQVERLKNPAGKTEVQAFLTPGSSVDVRWKPQIRKLEGELAVTCDGKSVAVASVGALKLNTVFTYRVIQGLLERMSLEIPEQFNVTQVLGEDIREWTLTNNPSGGRVLNVILSRPKDRLYSLRIEGERVLPAFPCKFELPVVAPKGVIRASGFLLLGTDSAIKLLVDKSAGLNQIDAAAFPRGNEFSDASLPTRSALSYQYAHLPFKMQIAAEDVITAMSGDERLTVSYEDNGATIDGAIDIEVRDAPAREVVFETDPQWAVAQVQGAKVSDYDVQDRNGKREIHVYLQEAVIGHLLLTLRLERTLGEGLASFTVPRLVLRDARAERGYVVLRAEKGVRLKEQKNEGLSEVHTASVPFRVPDAQRAYRFKSSDWILQMAIEQADAALHAELFHLVSLGEGALYGSVSTTYRIEGAPVRRFVIKIPEAYQNIEFTGRDIRSWTRDGALVTVLLQEKVLGDYTLLLTYDQPFAYEGAELLVGGTETVGSASEMGYMALSGAASLAFDPEKQQDTAVISITPDELPREYSLLVNDPVLKAYKCVGIPHIARVMVHRIGTQAMLDHVADHISLRTKLSGEGEAVTEATYFVKNTSHQFLGITLPENARLWTAKVDGDKVRVLDDSKGMKLIPIKRLNNANTPSRVELTYAESRPKLRWFSRLNFAAPVCAAQGVFARWTVVTADKFSLLPSGGNMMPPNRPKAGLVAMVDSLIKSFRIIATESFSSFVWAGIAGLMVLLLAYLVGRKGWGSGWSIVLLLVCVGIGIAVLADGMRVCRAINRVMAVSQAGSVDLAAQAVFTKAVTLADRDLSVGVQVLPTWLGGVGSLFRVVSGVLIGMGIILFSWLGERQAKIMALGLTVIAWGVTSIPGLVHTVAIGVMVIIPLMVIIGLIRKFHALGKLRRLSADADMRRELPPPFSSVAMPSPAVPSPEPPPAEPAGTAGHVKLNLMGILAAFSLLGLILPVWAEKNKNPFVAPEPEVLSAPVMDDIQLKVEAPDPAKDRNGIAKVELTLVFTTKTPVDFRVMPPCYVLIESSVTAKQGEIRSSKSGYMLHLNEAGSYKLVFKGFAPVTGQSGSWQLPVCFQPHLKNSIVVSIPATGWDVTSPQAAWQMVTEKNRVTTGTLKLIGTAETVITWQPRERKTKLEKTVFYCDLQSYAMMAPGLVNITHLARFQIAQGEAQSFRFTVPVGMSVTSVDGEGVGTWRFEQDSRVLEVLMEKPVSGDLAMAITTQMPREGLPYEATLMVPVVEGCARQRGSVALSAGGAVQIRVDDPTLKGLSRMNLGDFPAEAVAAALKGTRYAEEPEVKHAYRYHDLPVSLSCHAERVLPELRVTEQASLDISDERVVLSSKLNLAISRAGLFDLRLELPEKYDIESLTGDDISHWDELREGGHSVVIHYRKQALGNRAVNVVLGKMEKGVESRIQVPRIGVRDAVKHVGTLAVSGERGVRLLTGEREGVSELHPKELGLDQPGYLAFRILRPEWSVALKTESLMPVVRADVVQRVDLSEGMLHGHCFVQYKIDQAGVKTFRLKAPAGGLPLTISGRNVAKVSELDRTNGLWEVELQGKVENRYTLDVSYQQPVDPKAKTIMVVPLQTVGAESQKGYVVVFTGGRLQVRSEKVPAGLYDDDARNIPASFGAGDLSDAILCYRTTRPDYQLTLSAVRHESADMLPARVQNVHMISVLSDDKQMVTRVTIKLQTGSLRALAATLPQGAVAWSAFVNDSSVTPLQENGKLLIPLESARMLGTATVELTYASPAGFGGGLGKQKLNGPRFNVPLTDVRWDVYAPPDYRYYGFGGSLTHKDEWQVKNVVVFDAAQYEQETRNIVMSYNARAEEVLKQGENLWKQGKQAEAKQSLQQAMELSKGQTALNEDARIQYRNLMRQQAVVGFFSRRAALKKYQNVSDDYESGSAQANMPIQQVAAGNWTADYGKQLEQQLDTKDSDNLNKVADKMLEQQAAAQVKANPIRVTLPVQGQHLAFYRELQIHPDAEMTLEFKTSSGRIINMLLSSATALLLCLMFWLAIKATTARA